MFFWFKKKKVVLECFTTDETAFNYAKVESMIKFFPDWWKKTKKIDENISTIKNCVGLIDYYKKGITIPLWTRLKIILHNDTTYHWKASGNIKIDSHHNGQFKYFALNDGFNIKIISPWHFRTNKLKYFLISNPLYNNRNVMNYITVMPGAIEFKYNHDTNVNFFVYNIKEDITIELEPFIPIFAMHPLFDDEIEIKNFLVDEKELNKIQYSKFFHFGDENLTSAYKNKKKIIDYVESNRSKCPFGFK